MNRVTVALFADKMIKEYPVLKSDIIDYINLAIDEIEDGGSPSHEWELAYDSINELVLEHVKNIQDEEIID
jgi:hypothetical protein